MFVEPCAHLILPGSFAFPSNVRYYDLAAAGGRVAVRPTGHRIIYGSHGRRILATDPKGHPLHECEWNVDPEGQLRLVRARIRLDWGQWVGITPGGLVNATVLDLSRKSGWQRLRADDLRQMAAQALRVPLDEVRFFYTDADLKIDEQGRATIQHRKDAFYVLDGGTFDRARFMACMGTMHWEAVDFLPVVELFQSLLPGTGSAAFEVIRGLYDDQNEGRAEPLALRYRGIPTYPSEAAFQLFSTCFVPTAPAGQDPFTVFMDPSRSYQVTWLPAPSPPRRYFDSARSMCVTIRGDTIEKVTLADDPSGLSYTNVERGRGAPYDRWLSVEHGVLRLHEGQKTREFPVDPAWGSVRCITSPPARAGGPHWTALFVDGTPEVKPVEAFSAVVLYPEDDTQIEESASQPFVGDYLEDLTAEQGEIGTVLARARSIVIDNFDAALGALVQVNHPARYTILYRWPNLAQRQAQQLRSRAARTGDFTPLTRVQFRRANGPAAAGEPCDVRYQWVPFADHGDSTALASTLVATARTLRSGGLAFVVGPEAASRHCSAAGLVILNTERVSDLPTFHMHRRILPKATVKADLTLFHLVKPGSGSGSVYKRTEASEYREPTKSSPSSVRSGST